MPDSDELIDLERLSPEENLELLQFGRIGRVGFVADGVPHVLPVNYRADDQGTIVFRTTPASTLNAVAGARVAFEVDGFDERLQTGWSVCVGGRGQEITGLDDPTAQRLQRLSVVTWAPGRRERWFAITPDVITGRRLPLKATASDFGWMPGIVG